MVEKCFPKGLIQKWSFSTGSGDGCQLSFSTVYTSISQHNACYIGMGPDVPRMEICPDTPSPYPIFPKNRNAAAMCSFIHLRFSYGSVNVGIPRNLSVPLRSPRAMAWNLASSSAGLYGRLSSHLLSSTATTAAGRSGRVMVSVTVVAVDMAVAGCGV